MSGLEIERKFLVKKGDAYKSAAFSDSHIQQGYIPAKGATVRVRTRDDKAYHQGQVGEWRYDAL